MALTTWLGFFAAAWLISLSPGAGAFSCMSAGLRYGYRKAIWNIFGLQAGVLILVSVVALGLGAMLAASSQAFNVIKWLGAAYLVWLGIVQWRQSPEPTPAITGQAQTPQSLFIQGLLVNISNPKGIIFMLAVLPQFIDPHAPQLIQYVICTATLFLTDMVVMSAYTLLAARVLATLREPMHIRWINRTIGSCFIGAGLLLASFKRV